MALTKVQDKLIQFPLNGDILGGSAKIQNAGGWSVTPSGTNLYFNYNGVNVAKLDSLGNLTAIASVSASNTI